MGVGEREELAAERRAILREQSAHALHVLAEHAEPFAGRAVVQPVGLVLLLEPPAAQAEHDAAVGDLVECGHRVREHRGMAVPRGVDERAAHHRGGRRRERRVGRDRLETVRVAGRVGRVEVVPDRDPLEAELLDARPELAQLRDARVLQAGVHSESDVHGAVAPRFGGAAQACGASSAAMARK